MNEENCLFHLDVSLSDLCLSLFVLQFVLFNYLCEIFMIYLIFSKLDVYEIKRTNLILWNGTYLFWLTKYIEEKIKY
jgi:hypothetical protein